MTAYDHDFFEAQGGESAAAARKVVPLVAELLSPTSVLDVGAGTCGWIAEWQRSGVRDVLGVDGAYVEVDQLKVEPQHFRAADLSQPLDLGRTFDLVQTLEVAEHLDHELAGQFVDSLVRHGDTVLFSAAIPGQGGTHHVNEQWPSYWIRLFADAGLTCFDVLRSRVWTDAEIPSYYRQNLLLFSRRSLTHLATGSAPVDIVHPEFWEGSRDVALSGSAHLRGALHAVGMRLGRTRTGT